jgi:putative transposase
LTHGEIFYYHEHRNTVIGRYHGVDLGLKNFAITSNGSNYDLPKKRLAKLEKNRKRQQKKLARKKDKASNKRQKAKRLVAKISSKIARVREDFLHKLSRKIAYENQVICVEDLAVKNMVKNPNLAKAISDQGWGMFLTMLKYKAERFGHTYIEINRFFPSSQLCSQALLLEGATKMVKVLLPEGLK